MSNELTIRADSAMIEKVVVGGDLSVLTPAERLSYYRAVCESLELNPLTKPFDYIRLNNKLVLYAKRDCTDQLRGKRRINITIPAREKVDDVYIVTAKATMPDGRTDESIGAVNVSGLKGDSLANALMKAETKAKRRVTLSIVGLGWLDELEIETIPDAQPGIINVETGEAVAKEPTPEPPKTTNGSSNGKAKAEPRPALSPLKVLEALTKKVSNSTLRDKETGELLPVQFHPFGGKTPQILASRFQAVFKTLDDVPESPEAMYKTCLYWLTNHVSANELSAAWADAILDWLCGSHKADKFKAAIVPPAPAEALSIYYQALAEVKADEEAESILGDEFESETLWPEEELPEEVEVSSYPD